MSSSFRVPDLNILIAGKIRLSESPPVQVQLHVARALELLEDHLVHATARIDERTGQNRETAGTFDVSGGTKENVSASATLSPPYRRT
jgi:hypothetical protein